MTKYVFDLDGTICEEKQPGTPLENYKFLQPKKDMIIYINKLYDNGDYIIINTARHMDTTGGNIGRINARVGKITLDWLDAVGVKYHEILFGKPRADFYVDDRAMGIGSFLEKMKGDFPE